MNKVKSAAKSSKPAYKGFEKFRKSKFTEIMYDNGVMYYLLAFFIPFIVFLAAFQREGVFMLQLVDGKLQETGDRQFLVVDLWHQYYPFYQVVREKLLTGGSFLYSWKNGLGTNFISLISYYSASPLNWLSVFFDDDHVRESFMLFIAAKIGFCGAFFNYFLRYTYNRKDLSTVAFSVMFALCSYMCGYYWNVMWFDTIAMFPLVMTGIVALCREGKWKLYTVSLALSLIFNYYVGFFTCIFTVFMFASQAIIEWQGLKKFFIRIWLILRSSVIAVCLGAFMLIPSYLGLKLTYSANNTFPKEVRWAEKWQDIFADLISFVPPTTKEGLPNIACGMLAITLFGVFLFAGGIKIREKVAYVLLMALIIVSCNENQLNFIWHGFHITNQLPYRYAFIFSFMFVMAAYRAYDIMLEKGIKLYQFPLLLIGPAAEFYICYISRKDTEDGFSFSETALKASLYFTGAYILIIVCVKFISFKNKNFFRAVFNTLICVIVGIEMTKHAFVGVNTVGTSDRTTYPSYNESVQTLLKEMRERETKKFYRTEITTNYTLNDSALYGYNGLSQFSSSANVSVTRLCQRLGLYGSEAANRFYYRTSTPVVNSLLGIDYLVSKLTQLKSSSAFFDEVSSCDPSHLYKNKYSLSLGFMMNEEILEMDDTGGVNPFEYQNTIIKKATGRDIDVFTPQPVQLVSYDNMEVNKSDYGQYTFSKTDSSESASVTYDFGGVNNGYLYSYVKGSGIENVSVECDGTSVDSNMSVGSYSISFPCGDGQEGSTSSVILKASNDSSSGSYTLVTYALGMDAFEEAYSYLEDEQFRINEFTDTKITGYVIANRDGVLYFSIPYEKGWSVYVDGEKAETFKVLNAMLGVKASAGKHEIVLKYSPDGFKEGIIIGFGALFLFILFAYLDSRRNKKALLQTENSEEKNKEEKTEETAEDVVTEEKSEEVTNAEASDEAPEAEKAPEKKEDTASEKDSENVKKNVSASKKKQKGNKKGNKK